MRQGFVQCPLLAFGNAGEEIHDPRFVFNGHLSEEAPALPGELYQVGAPVGGIGFRGIAEPFVVGFVDIGWGGEGAAVFSGINYPF